jgi:outer membrane lipoprotein-sorting protein
MEYASPGEVVVVADGTSVLVYEAPLSLTTVHSQKEVVSQAINLLLGARSVGELSGIYDLREVVDKDVDWAILTPKEAQMEWLKKISLGFERGDLSKVEVDTSAGERLLFQLNWLAADQVEMSRFIFAPPAGSDIVDKSAKP